ncbi:MAG: ABC transporter permease [Verrucomicrobia bacterium]|nr:ABC transporter permease [Verrucomicrobiota bacterium]MCH8510385.1 ABC transporter permease [Kiritimatiellia bacterium]
MRVWLTLWKREVASIFFSPVAYILTTMFLAVMGVGFWSIASYRLTDGATIYEVLRGLYGGVAWFAVLMVIPVLTMRSFSDEKRSGTLEALLTAPVTDQEVVLAKFFGLLTVYVIMWLPTAAYILILNHLNDAQATVDTGALSGAYLGIMLIGSFFLSIGLFCSSLTENVIVSSISTFAIIGLIFLFGFLPEVSPIPALQTFARPFSPILHMLDFARGVVDTRPVVLYVSGTVFMLVATVSVLDSRRWRS